MRAEFRPREAGTEVPALHGATSHGGKARTPAAGSTAGTGTAESHAETPAETTPKTTDTTHDSTTDEEH